ncbi:MAG: porin, partial [Myxococcales bacterium]|nr:porin [Myxococcales bacterium]
MFTSLVVGALALMMPLSTASLARAQAAPEGQQALPGTSQPEAAPGEAPNAPDASGAPAAPDASGAPAAPDASGAPAAPGVPTASDAPATLPPAPQPTPSSAPSTPAQPPAPAHALGSEVPPGVAGEQPAPQGEVELPPDPAPESAGLAPEGEAQLTADRPADNAVTRFRLGKGLAFESGDGDFAMVPRLRAQFMYTVDAPDTGSAIQSFQIRRARLQFTGHFWGKHNKYKTELAVSPRDVSQSLQGPGTSILLDWYLDFTHLRDASLRVGQYKVPFNRQRVISSGDLQFVDRSIVNARFNVDRDLGIDIRSKDLFGLGLLRYYAGIYVGEGRNTFRSADFGMMYLARLEILPLGDFKDYKEVDLSRNPSPKLSLGLGAGYLDRAKRNRGILGSVPADGGTTDVSLFNADLVFMYAGLSVFTEMIMRGGSRNPGDATALDDAGEEVAVETEPAKDGFGLMTQVGYLLPGTNFEIAVRAGAIEPLGNASALAPETELGGALSYYFAHHPLKLQLDYFRLTEGEGDAEA